MISRDCSLSISTPAALAASRYQLDRQLRQKPPRFIMSMFCTSVRSRRCCTSRRNAAASKSRCWVSLRSVIAATPSNGPASRTELLHHMHIGHGVDRFKDRLQTLRPGMRACVVTDQVLPDLDQHMRIAVDDCMAIERVAAQGAVIGLIVAHH